MSIVTVQLGQCGNQISSQFFSTVANDLQNSPNNRLFAEYKDECVDRFFSVDDCGKWTARAVMVDTEPKVVIISVPFHYSLLLSNSQSVSYLCTVGMQPVCLRYLIWSWYSFSIEEIYYSGKWHCSKWA